ncbi:cytochrome P450 4C1-like [Adelges cooleyi]|uniref:cytochrome P450 4C1-like n=1 Tax=Adelges cooleyi TaxID=133065 RepID=UPI00217F5654|nr:cytochrome P450 4C1-like [Adelges cooleyi]
MNWLSIFSGALASVSNISIIIWLLLITLLTCRLYKIYYDERAIERRKQISLLPSLTKTYLETINCIWQVASLRPLDTLPYFSSVLKSVGPLVYMNTIIRDYVLINDPDDIKILLSSTQHITKGPEYSILEPWLSTGLLTSTDEKWQTRRKLLTNTFHFKILESYIPAFNHHANGLVQSLAKASKNNEIDLHSHVTLCALDIADIREELQGIFGDSDRDATMEDLKSMFTLERVIKETMRLYPSVPSVTRRLNQPIQLKNHSIPAHSIIAFSIYILHRDESMYPNPEVFDPDRFLPEQCNDRHPYGYLPFSAGSRNCIGQKFAMYLMKTVLSTVVRHMKLETLGTQKDIVVSTQLVLKADSLPSLKLTPLFENHKK